MGVKDILKFQKIAFYMSKMGIKDMAAIKVGLSRFISATIGEWKLVFTPEKIDKKSDFYDWNDIFHYAQRIAFFLIWCESGVTYHTEISALMHEIEVFD